MLPTVQPHAISAMSRIAKPLSILGLAAVLCATPGPTAAQAPAAPAPTTETMPGWQFQVMGYLWIAATEIDFTGPNGRTYSERFGFIDTIDHLHGIPFMGAAEARYGRFAILGDLIHLPVGGNIPTRGVLFRGGSLNTNTTIGTAVAFYTPIIDGAAFLDVGGGVRAYGISNLVSLHRGQAPGRSISAWASTTDPIIATRGHLNIGNGFGVDFYGDVGGFGVGTKLSWQVLGAVDYQLSRSVDLKLGYRYIRADLKSATNAVSIGGPFLAVSYRF